MQNGHLNTVGRHDWDACLQRSVHCESSRRFIDSSSTHYSLSPVASVVDPPVLPPPLRAPPGQVVHPAPEVGQPQQAQDPHLGECVVRRRVMMIVTLLITRPPAIAVIPVAVRPTPATTNKSAPPYLISVSTTCHQSRIRGVHELFSGFPKNIH